MTVSVETRLQSTCDMTLKEDTLERALNPWQCFSCAQMLYESSRQQETQKIPGCNQPHPFFSKIELRKREYV